MRQPFHQTEPRLAGRAVAPGRRYFGDAVAGDVRLGRDLERVLKPARALDRNLAKDGQTVGAKRVRRVVCRQRAQPVKRYAAEPRERSFQDRAADLPTPAHIARCAHDVVTLVANQPDHVIDNPEVV